MAYRTAIENLHLEPVALPLPLTGLVGGLKRAVVAYSVSTVSDLFGGDDAVAAAGLRLVQLPEDAELTSHNGSGSVGLVLADGAPAAVSDAAVVGTAVQAAREDHAHALAATTQHVATLAEDAAVAGVPVQVQVAIADAASGDKNVVLTYKMRVQDVQIVKRGGAGASGNSYVVKNGANAITDTIDGNITDKKSVKADTIDDAYYEIDAGGTLRVTWVKSGGNSAALVIVKGVKVA